MTTDDVENRLDSNFYDKAPIETFFEDLVSAFGLDQEHPATTKMYSLAWKNGHAAGHREVYYHFKDLVEVFKA